MLEQHARGDCDQQIGMSDAEVVRALDLCNYLLPIGVERAAVNFTRDEEVRDGGPALCRPLGHQAAESAGEFEAARLPWGRARCNRCGRGLHVRRKNLAAWARTAYGGDVDTQFFR